MNAAQVYEVEFTTLTYGGEALGRLPDGRAVFVPFSLPGEKARVRLVEERRSHARGELVEILQPAHQRISPRCAHFGVCGGCHYQHLDYPEQLVVKSGILLDQLERIGGLHDPPLRPSVPSPQPFYYRNHVQFHLSAQGKLGYHPARSDEVLAIRECHLPLAEINLVWPQLDFEALPDLERIGLRQGSAGEMQLILESRDPQPPEFTVEEMTLSAVHLSPAGALVLAGSEYVVIEVLGRPFRVSAGAFFQVNSPLAGAMVEHVLENLALEGQGAVVDAYCGVGLFSAFLAPRVARLVGIEASPAACEDFAANLDEFENVELYEGQAEEVLPYLELQPEAVLVDPPRAGLDRRVLDAMLAMHPRHLVYVSCDPATLARDARRLVEGGYRLDHITPFDLFPQTYHIESVSFWSPAG